MATFVSTHTPPVEEKHIFEFSQREVNLLISVLFDLVVSDGVIKFGDKAYTPSDKTHKDLDDILTTLREVGMSVDNDYLSNFHEVVL